ncbi:MAG: hypothetical protein HZA31_04435 [Opitutae bacterium]|nr:hypothetical protein [Opitutae bacterium]
MELNLQSLATVCFVTGQPFADGQRVASFLVRDPKTPEIFRYDLLESAVAEFVTPGPIVCRWVQVFKPRRAGENPDRALKLTAENLFITLADPANEPTPENTRLLQFLALMLERKRILRPRGISANGESTVYEHMRLKQHFSVPVGELTPEFFVQVQEQLSVLVGVGKPKAAPTAETPVAPVSSEGAEVAAKPAENTAPPAATP